MLGGCENNNNNNQCTKKKKKKDVKWEEEDKQIGIIATWNLLCSIKFHSIDHPLICLWKHQNSHELDWIGSERLNYVVMSANETKLVLNSAFRSDKNSSFRSHSKSIARHIDRQTDILRNTQTHTLAQ